MHNAAIAPSLAALSVVVVALVTILSPAPATKPRILPTPSVSVTPSPQPTQLAGTGPFIVWSDEPHGGPGVSLFGTDLSLATPEAPPPASFLGSFLDVASTVVVSQADASFLPLIANDDGWKLVLLQRGPARTIDDSFVGDEELIASPDGRRVAWLTGSSVGHGTVVIRRIDDAAVGSRSTFSWAIPSLRPGGYPGLLAWLPGNEGFLLGLSCPEGCVSVPSTYILTPSGRLQTQNWLRGRSLSFYGTVSRDGTTFVFAERSNHSLAVADLRKHTVRTILSSARDFFLEAVPSPDGALVAYSHSLGNGGAQIEIARTSDGKVLEIPGGVDAADVYPVCWIDATHLIAQAGSPDLITGEATSALLEVPVDIGSGAPAVAQTVAVGTANLRFLGWFR